MDIKLTPEEKDTTLDKTWGEERAKGLDTSDGECIDAQISDAIAQAQVKKCIMYLSEHGYFNTDGENYAKELLLRMQ